MSLCLCAVLLVIGVNGSLNVVIDDDAALNLAVVEVLGNLGHVDDGGSREAVELADLVKRALFAALANFHAVEGDHQALNLNIGCSHEDGMRLLDGLAGSGNVLNDEHAVTVAKVGTQEVAGVSAVVLGFLAVGAVANLLAIKFADAHGGDDGQRNSFVGGAEDDVEVKAEVIVDCLRVVQAEAMKLIAGDVCAGIHEEGGLAAALQGEITELQNVAFHHEFDEFLLVGFHVRRPFLDWMNLVGFMILNRLAYNVWDMEHGGKVEFMSASWMGESSCRAEGAVFCEAAADRAAFGEAAADKAAAGKAPARFLPMMAACALALVAALLSGCADGAATYDDSELDSLQKAEVVRVVDGDTLQVKIDGNKEKVRLIGINCPESVANDERRNTAEGVDASDYTKSLVRAGDIVWLQSDYNDTDQYDRLLRYVWLEKPSSLNDPDEVASKMLNGILVHDGYADARRYDEDVLYADVLEDLEDDAVANDRGVSYMWA